MKKFICVVPQQPPGSLQLSEYEAVGNSKLKYGATRFPVIPLINAYAQKDEEIHVIVVMSDYEHSRVNYEYFKEEFAKLQEAKGFRCPELDLITIPYLETLETHLTTFRELFKRLEDNDDLYACITYGNKPVPLVEVMALKYAHGIRRNVSISCIVYGLKDYSVTPHHMRIFDVTALVQLDEIVHEIIHMNNNRQIAEPDQLITELLEMSQPEPVTTEPRDE